MKQNISTFNAASFRLICRKLAEQDADLGNIIRQYDYPPMWTRPASFQSLILFILEQQVSLASAYAAFKKLRDRIGFVTPAKILALSDAELRACYFSRQKIVYARELAMAVRGKKLVLKKLTHQHEDEIRGELKKIKGIGDWTADVYLLFALQRTDVFPVGDLAMVNALKEIKQLPAQTSKDHLLSIAESWRPYRSIAAMLLWHHYIKTRNIKL